MSTSLIVGLAFFVGFVFSYKLLKEVIKNALNDKAQQEQNLQNEEIEKFRRDMLEYYKKSSEKIKN